MVRPGVGARLSAAAGSRGAEGNTNNLEPPDKAVALCSLLEKAGAGALRLERGGLPGSPSAVHDRPGFTLVGGGDDSRREAAAEIVDCVLRYEEEIRSLSVEILERYEEAVLVYRLCEKLGALLGEEAIAQLVLDDAARVLGARSGEVWLRIDDGLRLVAASPRGAGVAGGEPDEAVAQAAGLGRPYVLEAASGVAPVAAVPLPGSGGPALGVLCLKGRSDGRSYRTGEIKLLTALASVMSAFVTNARLAAQVRKAEARRREDEIARQVYLGLLPHGDPFFPGLEIAGGHRAAENVGGDYYGYIPMPDGSLGIAAADVSGHGIGAALYMAATKGALQSQARRTLEPSDLLRRTNDVLTDDLAESDVFTTAFFARFHRGGRRMDYVNAGHVPPLLVRADGTVDPLEGGGPALGIFKGLLFEQRHRLVGPGDVLVLYTDGLVEARDERRRPLGIESVARVVAAEHRADAPGIRQRLFDELDRHCAGRPPEDDVTLVVVKVTGETRDGEAGE